MKINKEVFAEITWIIFIILMDVFIWILWNDKVFCLFLIFGLTLFGVAILLLLNLYVRVQHNIERNRLEFKKALNNIERNRIELKKALNSTETNIGKNLEEFKGNIYERLGQNLLLQEKMLELLESESPHK